MRALNFNPFPVLKTKRLILRKMCQEDAKLLFDYQSNKLNFPHVEMQVYTNISQSYKYITEKNEAIQKNKWIIWAITYRNSNKILGTISLWNFNAIQETAEFGYGLFPGNTSKGIMTESLLRVIEFGFNEVGMKTIEAYTSILNVKSINLLKRADFSYINRIEEESSILGIYRLLQKDWLKK